MSLTAQLKDKQSAVRRFFEERFPETRDVVQPANALLRGAETIRPCGSVPWSTLGTALDYRARYCFEITPSDRLIAWQGAMQTSDETIWWQITEDGEVGLKARDGDPSLSKATIDDFFLELDDTLQQLQPSARRLARNEEELLGRYCVVLALFEECYRAGSFPQSPLFSIGKKPTVDELLNLAADNWVDDLCALAGLFVDSLEHRPFDDFVLNPTFEGSGDIGGADADVILDNCLLDIKSTVKAGIQKLWLYQLLGYVLLDYSDRFELSMVGFYMARQGKFMEWPIDNLLETLSAKHNRSLADLRGEFHHLLQESLP